MKKSGMQETEMESSITQEPVKEELRVLLTQRTATRILYLGMYLSLFTIVAGALLCVFGPWPSSIVLRWFISIPLGKLLIGVGTLAVFYHLLLYKIDFKLFMSSYPGDDRVYQKIPEVLAYYPRTFQEALRVFLVLVDVYILSLAFGYLIPIGLLQSVFALGFEFLKLSKGYSGPQF
jgi:hypothetical protein